MPSTLKTILEVDSTRGDLPATRNAVLSHEGDVLDHVSTTGGVAVILAVEVDTIALQVAAEQLVDLRSEQNDSQRYSVIELHDIEGIREDSLGGDGTGPHVVGGDVAAAEHHKGDCHVHGGFGCLLGVWEGVTEGERSSYF